ncbi:hypothetical protein EV561_11361 [Rhizobium sp. BK376]|nr:hypothetical protein EV561_11361 [Rhizobium sp. BK376]
MSTKVVRWLFFTVLLSVVPIVGSYVSGTANNKPDLSLWSVLDQGDLYLLCTAFCCAGLGELIGLGVKKGELAKIIVGRTATFHILACIFLYVLIRNPSPTTDTHYLVSLWGSL